jgi:hypothetical protein
MVTDAGKTRYQKNVRTCHRLLNSITPPSFVTPTYETRSRKYTRTNHNQPQEPNQYGVEATLFNLCMTILCCSPIRPVQRFARNIVPKEALTDLPFKFSDDHNQCNPIV